jgi:hypothetical protein
MPRITDEAVSTMNDRIAQATSPGEAWDLIDGLSPRMLELVLDLNGESDRGRGEGARLALGWAHGFTLSDRGDYLPANSNGPCSLGGFEPHSRRPWECRGCKRRRFDHRVSR